LKLGEPGVSTSADSLVSVTRSTLRACETEPRSALRLVDEELEAWTHQRASMSRPLVDPDGSRLAFMSGCGC